MLRKLHYRIVRDIVGPVLLKTAGAVARRKQRPRPEDSLFGPRLESEVKLKEALALHYFSGRYADGAVPVAWVTSGAPVEVLRPFGYHVVYPENHAALCGAQKVGVGLGEKAEERGYARDLCGYARCDLGTAFGGKTPVGRLPKPDLLVVCTNICQSVMYWYRVLGRHFRVPIVLVDTPFLYGESQPHQIEYIAGQIKTLVDTAAGVAGKKLDETAFIESLLNAREGTLLWGECLAMSKARPAPWSAFDQFIHMALIVAARGTRECNDYYKMLLEELKDRVSRGIGGITDEKYRLLWDNLPVWYKMRGLATTFAQKGFHLVAATYTNAWAETAELINTMEPFLALAQAYSHVILNRDLPNRLRVMSSMVREYSCDGVVLHSDRSCKPYSLGQVDLKDKISRECGVRSVLLEADHIDSRSWADGPVETRLSAFMESFQDRGEGPGVRPAFGGYPRESMQGEPSS